jgi:hypothetical protein
MADMADTLTAKQQRTLAALLAEPSISAAAVAAGVGERTVYRWLDEDTPFIDAYRAARLQVVRHAVVQLQRASVDAVGVLCDVMRCENERGATRVAAARAVLDTAIRAVELEDLEARITQLERAGHPA